MEYRLITTAKALKFVNDLNRKDFVNFMNFLCDGENFSRGTCITHNKKRELFQRINSRTLGIKQKKVEFFYEMDKGKFTLKFFINGKLTLTKKLTLEFDSKKAVELRKDLREFFSSQK